MELFGEQTGFHIAEAAETGVGMFGGNEQVDLAEFENTLQPGRSAFDVQVVIVTEFIALTHDAVGDKHVVLSGAGVGGEITLAKLVHVYIKSPPSRSSTFL